MSTPRKRPGIADSAGRAAFYPARVAARAWRGGIESAAEDVVSAPELARIVDSALAGPLPEEIARSLVRHQVIERVVRELAATGELERLIEQSLGNRQTLELTDRVLASDEMQRMLESIASSPELRRAVTRQSAGSPRTSSPVFGTPRPVSTSGSPVLHSDGSPSTRASRRGPRRSPSTRSPRSRSSSSAAPSSR